MPRTTQRARRWLRSQKALSDDADLSLWRDREVASLVYLLAARLLRGSIIRARIGRAGGYILADRNVRVHHPRHVSAGRGLSLEEGCEIVGLSKRGIAFGQRCTVGRFATIRPTNVLLDEPGEGLVLGDNSNIGPYSFVGCSGFVSIGSNVMMGPRVNLLAEQHNTADTERPMNGQGVTRSSLTIADDCWIGANSTILPGVSIGEGSIVGAGSVVTRDVPPFSVVVGSPARVVRSRRKP